ncbi:MAG: phosphate transport system regulatory protein PhoU [Lachnospiraceae bacterium]|uniref:Phosphate-specific transport system accessory protein PhoU n=1 Tax=Candidatus Weimeria bifida TaxID=2599074 RepID=A0A6N7IWL2_9FIRM|nr:phosphate signaling complex protein PhoU [Candidatus Weimeria bifida]RRF96128.1 MAG: phosphate transport system regulatory protein PhoU [Lachnospiraceae bacterium]
MRDNFNAELKELNSELVEMGKMCVDAIHRDVDALADEKQGDIEEIKKVSENIAKKQQEIEDLCYSLIIKEQPVAGDLRMIHTASNVIIDMQRIGVNAYDVAEIIPYVADSQLKTQVPILMMADAASYMVSKSVESLVNRDSDQARKIIAYDDEVDDLFDEVKASVIEAIRGDKKKDASPGIDIMMIAKYFERMGDHSESIARHVLHLLNQ